MAEKIAVLDYGMGNIHSIVKALRLFCDDVCFTDQPGQIEESTALVLPGDGAFAAAMSHLNERFRDVIDSFVASGKPVLGVCIGFQVLFSDSDEFALGREGEPVPGLGLIPGKIRRFQNSPGVRVPHMGWNVLTNTSGELTPWEGDYMYFIHSYRAVEVPPQFAVASCSYGSESFVAAVRHNNVFGVQFHPEKSHTAGLKLLEQWVRGRV